MVLRQELCGSEASKLKRRAHCPDSSQTKF